MEKEGWKGGRKGDKKRERKREVRKEVRREVRSKVRRELRREVRREGRREVRRENLISAHRGVAKNVGGLDFEAGFPLIEGLFYAFLGFYHEDRFIGGGLNPETL